MSIPFDTSQACAQQLDAADSLAPFRQQFHIPPHQGHQCVYLCGNSLGLQPKRAAQYIQEELDDWARLGVEGHVQARRPWMPYHELLTQRLASLVGALPTEVVAMNNLTVNLHLLLVSFYRPTTSRYKIAIEANAFPSDVYAVKSQLRYHGYGDEALLVLQPRAGEATLRTADIIATLEREGGSIATLLLGGVNYLSGQLFDIASITRVAQAQGIVVGYDLAHAAGNVTLQLHHWGVDFACWCSYKYLNAGPGSTAGIFVHERHHRAHLPRFEGWWGHNKQTRFLMGPHFDPIPTAEAWQLSNPSIFPMAALHASLELFAQAGMEKLVAKRMQLSAYLDYLLGSLQSDRIAVITPQAMTERGCQVSIRVRGADKSLHQRLTERGVVADWREPDVIRIAPVPLYNSFGDVHRFYTALQASL